MKNCSTQGVATLQCLPILFRNVANFLFMMTGTVALIVIILAGIRLILANGDAKQAETARKSIQLAVGGLFLVFASYLIISIVAHVTGVSCILTIGPFDSSSCNK